MNKQKINVNIGIIGESIIRMLIIVDVERKNRRNIIYGKENESMFFLRKDRK